MRIVFDGPPGPESGRFVEVEDDQGVSFNAGEWRERPDGLWELVIPESADRHKKAMKLLREVSSWITPKGNISASIIDRVKVFLAASPESASAVRHTPRRRASGEYECSCGAVWDADEGSECPND